MVDIANTRVARLAFMTETSFATTGTNFDVDNSMTELLALDPSFTPKLDKLENNNSVRFPYDRYAMVNGLRSDSKISLGLYMRGLASGNAASGSVAVHTALSRHLLNSIGGALLSYRQGVNTATVTGASGTLTMNTAVISPTGSMLFAMNAGSTSGTFHQILSNAANVLTVRPAPPSVLAADSEVRACVTIYPDIEGGTIYTDSQHTTLAYYIQGQDTDDHYIAMGVKHSPSFEGLNAGEQPMVKFEGMVTDWTNAAATPTPVLTGSASVSTPVVVAQGTRTQCLLGTQDSQATSVVLHSIDFDPGLSWKQIPGIGGQGKEGRIGYMIDAAGLDPKLTIVIQHDTSWQTVFQANTQYHLMYQVGNSATEAFCFYFPCLDLIETPVRDDVDGSLAIKLVFRCRAYDGTIAASAGSDGHSAVRAPFIIGMVA